MRGGGICGTGDVRGDVWAVPHNGSVPSTSNGHEETMSQQTSPPSPGPDMPVPPALIGVLLLLTVILAVTFLVAAQLVQTP